MAMVNTLTLSDVAPYGVTSLNFGGCRNGSPIHPGRPGAMRRSAHAHCVKRFETPAMLGAICFKAERIENVRVTIFWHEVGHVWRPSWTETQCNAFGRKMARQSR